jgi:tetratricopeptide (TPR) repeat protein
VDFELSVSPYFGDPDHNEINRQQQAMNKPGRNDPCPCGSGKKYKKCCLSRDEAARPQNVVEDAEPHFTVELRPDLDEAVNRILAKVEAGAGREVETELKALLRAHSQYHSLHFAMGVFFVAVLKDPIGALPFFERAVGIFPPFPEVQFNLGHSALKACDIPRAVRAYRAAERYSQDDDGIADLARKELDGLEKILRKTSPFSTLDAYLANAKLFDEAFECLTRRDYEQAALLFNRVLHDNPEHVQSYGNLALAYAGLGKRSAALTCLDKALELDPTYAPAISNRRNLANMREGEPHLPDGIQVTHYYPDQVRQGK